MKANLFSYLINTSSFFRSKYNVGKLRHSLAKFPLTLCVLTISISIAPYWSDKAVAEKNVSSTSSAAFKVTFDPPAGDKPKTSTGGASRTVGQCINQAENSNLPLLPLVPVASQGLTIASHPTVLVYLPETTAQKVLFSWQSENNNDHYQTILPIEKQAGIISLTLPEDAPPLEIGKNYQWALAVMCDGRLQPDSPTIQGQIQRVEIAPTLKPRLQKANALETAAIYGEAGIWYDTVATLAELKLTQPNDSNLTSNWKELLTSVGLEQVAESPLVDLKGK